MLPEERSSHHMGRQNLAGIVLVATVVLAAAQLGAQSASPLSVQVSASRLGQPGVAGDLSGGGPRLGYEGQMRYSRGRWSLGFGYQEAGVFDAKDVYLFTSGGSTASSGRVNVSSTMRDVFVEPRVVVKALGRVGLYAAGRLGLAGSTICGAGACYKRTINETLVGGGGGILVALTRKASVDVGLQSLRFVTPPRLSYITTRLGASFGF